MGSTRCLGLLAAVLGLVPGLAWAQSPTPSVDVRATRVVLLPVLEKSGREGKEKEEFIAAASRALQEGFAEVGFHTVLADGLGADADEFRAAMAAEEPRTAET